MNVEVKKWNVIKDKRGCLVPLEFKDLPFIPKRLFYVTKVPRYMRRGEHAHIETQQIIICVKGVVGVKLVDKESKYYILKENDYIFVDKMVWDAQDFLTGDDILLVLCSTSYDKKDYIEQFIIVYYSL